MGYAPGRTHKGNKQVHTPEEIIKFLNKRKPGNGIILWSEGHTPEGGRVKAFKANKGQHPAWRDHDTNALEFTVSVETDGTAIWVRRVR